MPARSEAQRAYLAMKFGPTWMREHGFDNPGKLPQRVKSKRKRRHAKDDALTRMIAAGHKR